MAVDHKLRFPPYRISNGFNTGNAMVHCNAEIAVVVFRCVNTVEGRKFDIFITVVHGFGGRMSKFIRCAFNDTTIDIGVIDGI